MAKNKVEKLDEGQDVDQKDVVAVQMPPVVYSVTDKALAELRKKYKDVPDASTPEGMELCKEALRELVPLRTGIEKARVELKKDALDYGRKVDAEAKRITAGIVAIEKPIADAKTAEQERVEREKQAEIEAEQNRIDAIEGRLNSIRLMGEDLPTDVESLETRLNAIAIYDVNEEAFEEYFQQASEALVFVNDKVLKALHERKEFEAKQAEQDAEAERQAERQRELDAKQAELDKQAEDQRNAQEAEQRRLDEQREAQERQQREHDERIAEERRETEEREREAEAERERQEEEARQEQERLDDEKKERKRLAKLKPQLSLLISYVHDVEQAVDSVAMPELEDEGLVELRTRFKAMINEAVDMIEDINI